MQHYHEALNDAIKNPKDTWNLLRQLVPGKSKQKIVISRTPPEVPAHSTTFLQQLGIKRTTT